MAFWMILAVSGLEVVWVRCEGCASTRFCRVLGSFLRVSLGRFEGLFRSWSTVGEVLGLNLSSVGLY